MLDDGLCVFDYALEIACWFVHTDVQHGITGSVRTLDTTIDDPTARYLAKRGFPSYFHYHVPDGDPGFDVHVLQPARANELRDIFVRMASFRPQAPLSLRIVRCVAPVHYTHGNTILFIGESKHNLNCVLVIDPRSATTACVSVEALSKFVSSREGIALGGDDITEVTEVCFDASGSMRSLLNNKAAANRTVVRQPDGTRAYVPSEPMRLVVGWQCLSSFANRVFALRIPMLLGLVEFNKEIRTLVEFSPIVEAFETAADLLKPLPR
jgi:hypothetical protein